jgi:hypothetical protein
VVGGASSARDRAARPCLSVARQVPPPGQLPAPLFVWVPISHG